MNQDRESPNDSAVVDRYLKSVPGVDPAYLERLRRQLASAPHPKRRRRVTFLLPSFAIPSVVTIVAMMVGMVAVVNHDRLQTTGHPGTAANGGTILFSRQNHWYTIAPNGTHLRMLVSDAAGCGDWSCVTFSPDGTKITVVTQSANKKQIETAIINTNGSGYHVLPLPDSRFNLGPAAWAPNGSRIVFGGWDNTNKARAGLYVVNASDGKGLTRLTKSPDGRNDDPVAYSPDGSRLLYFHEGPQQHPDNGSLYVTSATGSGRVKLNPPGTYVTTEGWTGGRPASWSPDSKQITFTANTGTIGASAVFVADANGSNRHRITPWGMWITSANWSPDGNWIEFDNLAPGPNAHNLFLVHPNGTGLKQVTHYSLDGVCCAVWSPSGAKLLTAANAHLITVNPNGSGTRRLTSVEWNQPNGGYQGGYAWGR